VNLGFLFALERCAANHHFAYDQQIINQVLTILVKVSGSVTVAILAQGTQPKPIASSWRKFSRKFRFCRILKFWCRSKGKLGTGEAFAKSAKKRAARRLSKNDGMAGQRKIC
jgi:hypothetical protein|tara:strand:+ start:435 stop:770 length:336 start_codon:yes stop_codon:yes gene_type:complete